MQDHPETRNARKPGSVRPHTSYRTHSRSEATDTSHTVSAARDRTGAPPPSLFLLSCRFLVRLVHGRKFRLALLILHVPL